MRWQLVSFLSAINHISLLMELRCEMTVDIIPVSHQSYISVYGAKV